MRWDPAAKAVKVHILDHIAVIIARLTAIVPIHRAAAHQAAILPAVLRAAQPAPTPAVIVVPRQNTIQKLRLVHPIPTTPNLTITRTISTTITTMTSGTTRMRRIIGKNSNKTKENTE